MQIDLTPFIKPNQTVAVALSGGSDSMALLYYMLSVKEKYPFNLVAINVEHGIRGNSSLSDTEFVKSVCDKLAVPLYCYSVDCLTYAKEHKLSVEQAARIKRYDCFCNLLDSDKCDLIATAHHAKDNLESVLFNLFRGTGLKGLTGVNAIVNGKIIRPFVTVEKSEIDEYVTANAIPFVTDETNAETDYTRNAIRLNVLPQIEKLFPDAQKCVSRLSQTVALESDYVESMAKTVCEFTDGTFKIDVNAHPALISRAVVMGLKALGVERDWEKIHVDSTLSLIEKSNGAKINLLRGVIAVREYDKITLYRNSIDEKVQTPFSIESINFKNQTLSIDRVNGDVNLKSGLFADLDKIPQTAVIRTRRQGDTFTKFGGGTKSLNDYFTDAKIPARLRDEIPLLASESTIYVIFGYAVSDKVKVESSTENIIKFN
jgi:tRNA(Ile)-lysidine synthase